MNPTSSKYIEVRNSKIHSRGVFAKINIPKSTKIIEYVGEIITKKESDKRANPQMEKYKQNPDKHGGVYIFTLNKTHDIDGNVPWNTARLINHSCKPNCEAKNIDDHIHIIALKNIKKGQELSYDYGYDVDNYEEHPCYCGAENCVGYIVNQEQWPKLRRLIAKKEKQKAISKS